MPRRRIGLLERDLPAALAEIEGLRERLARQDAALERALNALEVAKYRLDGRMEYPGEPNSITSALAELRSMAPETSE